MYVVISKPCDSRSNVYGLSTEWNFDTSESAIHFAQEIKGSGRCVILRPRFNEKEKNSIFFREWRNFNGKEWRECRWDTEMKDDIHEYPSADTVTNILG
jgi:hypothetical protein